MINLQILCLHINYKYKSLTLYLAFFFRPIFGSYSYDPIQQIFEPPPHPATVSSENQNKLVNFKEPFYITKHTTKNAATNTSKLLPPYRKYVKPVNPPPSYLPGIKPNETAHLRYRPKIRTITFANRTFENTVQITSAKIFVLVNHTVFYR